MRVVPVFGLGPPLHIVLIPLVLSCPSCIVSLLLFFSSPPFHRCVFPVTVLVVCGVWQKGGCVLSPVLLFLHHASCVCCHGIVGLGLCLCGGVVSLWNSGDGLGGVEERVVSTVYCLLFMRVVCISVWCVL